MLKKHELRKLKLILLLPIGILLVKAASVFPSFVEQFYSRAFYRITSQMISTLTSWCPISLGEIGIIILGLLLIAILFKSAVNMIRGSFHRGRLLLNYLLNAAVFISVLYFSSVITFDLNYQRETFSEISDMKVKPANVNELYEVCKKLIINTNAAREKVSEDRNGVMELSGSIGSTFKNAEKGYETVSKVYPELGGHYSGPKRVIFSKVMSMLGLQGIHNPFTQEANINVDMPDSAIPSTACHEMAHQRGFAREDEANFIAYLTCSKNPEPDFQYSGDLMALTYCMNALYEADWNKFAQLRKQYSPGVVRDLTAYNKYWSGFEGAVQKMNDAINNAYLKANHQKDGIKSYGRMVDLVIAKYREDGLN